MPEEHLWKTGPHPEEDDPRAAPQGLARTADSVAMRLVIG
jgi:hypothetical protein